MRLASLVGLQRWYRKAMFHSVDSQEYVISDDRVDCYDSGGAL
jgi:hypothetical protein